MYNKKQFATAVNAIVETPNNIVFKQLVKLPDSKIKLYANGCN